MLSAEAKEARKAYKRQWARDHKEQVKETQERYWERRAAKEAAARAQDKPAKRGAAR